MAENPKDMARQQSLRAEGARLLATTTKSAPQMQEITPRWLLRLLPWVQVDSGTYRVNRRKMIACEGGKVQVSEQSGQFAIEPTQLRAIPLFRNMDPTLLEHLPPLFSIERVEAGDFVFQENERNDKLYIIARGKIEISKIGVEGEPLGMSVLGDGDYFGEDALMSKSISDGTAKALAQCLLLALRREQFDTILNESPELREGFLQTQRDCAIRGSASNEYGEAGILLQSDAFGEEMLPSTFVDYEEEPKEYPLNAIQTILRIHSRVSDLYNGPFDQTREQLRLAIEAMKERQEWELINNRQFGLVNVASPAMRVQSRDGRPTPDDMDELLARVWKRPAFFLAHPKAIAAFGRECSRRGVPPPSVTLFGSPFITWRGVPIVPCDKLMVNGRCRSRRNHGSTKILLMRVGEKEQGIVGLHKTGIPGEVSHGLSVRLMGIDNMAIASYLLMLYSNIAVLADDALGVLEDLEVGHYYDYE